MCVLNIIVFTIRPLPSKLPAAATSAPSSPANAAEDVLAKIDALAQEVGSAVDDVMEGEAVKKEEVVQQSAPQPAVVQQSAPQPAVEQVVQDTEVQQSAPRPAVDDVMEGDADYPADWSSPGVAVEQEVQDTEAQQSATQPEQVY